MKKFLVAVMFGLMAIAAQAEATFDQVQTLIEQREYQAAASGLEVIIQNHPKSAKAFYAMAQAQAGLGNQEKAQKALNIATGLNPTLDFAPASSVASLKQAITPQVAKIESIEESHTMRNVMMLLVLVVVGFAIWYARAEMKRKEEEVARDAAETEARDRAEVEATRQRERQRAASAKTTQPEMTERPPVSSRTVPTYSTPAPTYSTPAPTHTTVVNNTSSSNDLLTGVLIGNMMGSSHHHDSERVVTREVVREVPAPSRDSSWDDAPSKPSRSSSWDDNSSSSSKSSSWDSSSSSSSSSSWDSGSSDSGSSSSWD